MYTNRLSVQVKPLADSRRIIAIYAMGLVTLVAYVWHALAVNYVIDDSFITFRYVKNFVHGYGLVYNPGERVEGYTNFLWAMLLSAFNWFNPDMDLLPVAQALGILFGVATIVFVIMSSWSIQGEVSFSGLIAGAFLALNSAFVAWSTSGMETILFTFLVFAASYFYVHPPKPDKKALLAPVLFALASLARPEGLLFFAVTTLHLALTEARSGRGFIGKRVAWWLLAFAAIYVPYFAWRLNYYGQLLPNTFYAKVGSGIQQYIRGARYLLNYARGYGIFVFLLALPLLIRKKRGKWLDLLLLQTVCYLAYVVYVGGDGLGFYRFIVPVTPHIYLLVQEGIAEIYRWARPRLAEVAGRGLAIPMMLFLVLSFLFTGRQTLLVLPFRESQRWYEPQSELSFPGLGNDHSYLWFDNYFVDRLATAARWLEANAPPDAVVAATPAGAIGYYMNLRVIDMLGLNDLHIAHVKDVAMGTGRAGHEKGDGKYVLSRSPDYILMGNVAVLPRSLTEAEMAQKLVRKSENEIWADPDFHRRYELVSVKLSDEGVFRYFTFYKLKQSAVKGG
jgi:arabinofuranosyltransferase